MTEVPEAVVEVVRSWQAGGRRQQPAISWPRARWLVQFPDSADLFASLPDQLDRATVRAACSEAARSPAVAWQAFLVVMVWGQGRTGYGPWRTARILQATADTKDRLARGCSAPQRVRRSRCLSPVRGGLSTALARPSLRDQVSLLLPPGPGVAGADS
jgi:hypothetical protein